MPEWANLVGKNLTKSHGADDLAGGGIYACFWDDVLIYIGSFVGPPRDPFGRHVADRINKHVISLTLRGKKLGFSEAPLQRIIAKLDHEIADDIKVARANSSRLIHGQIKASYNKARFAKKHWTDLRNATPDELLQRFAFSYRRLAAPTRPTNKEDVKKVSLPPIEKRLIQHFQPMCNTIYRNGEDGPHVGISEVSEAFEVAFTAGSSLPR